MQGFGSMDILCVDKTGTLTGDEILLEYYMDILGNESEKVLDFCLSQQPLPHRREKPSGFCNFEVPGDAGAQRVFSAVGGGAPKAG